MAQDKPFPIQAIRARFPALAHNAQHRYFDNAAGAQLPDLALAAVNEHLLSRMVQRGARYDLSRSVDASIAAARQSVALLVYGVGIAFAIAGGSMFGKIGWPRRTADVARGAQPG